jgi:hypothetical protein
MTPRSMSMFDVGMAFSLRDDFVSIDLLEKA